MEKYRDFWLGLSLAKSKYPLTHSLIFSHFLAMIYQSQTLKNC